MVMKNLPFASLPPIATIGLLGAGAEELCWLVLTASMPSFVRCNFSSASVLMMKRCKS